MELNRTLVSLLINDVVHTVYYYRSPPKTSQSPGLANVAFETHFNLLWSDFPTSSKGLAGSLTKIIFHWAKAQQAYLICS